MQCLCEVCIVECACEVCVVCVEFLLGVCPVSVWYVSGVSTVKSVGGVCAVSGVSEKGVCIV